MKLFSILFCFLYVRQVRADQPTFQSMERKFLPIVIWHGMGDSCCNKHSVGSLMDSITNVLPGTFVHSINTGSRGGSMESDIASSYFGNVNEQIRKVCDELDSIDELRQGYVALGLSQGGQFLRGVAQRCHRSHRNGMHTLVTLGSQHQGVNDIPGCNETSRWCHAMQVLLEKGAFSYWVRDHSIQAQYFKPALPFDEIYLEKSQFLADINNERPEKNTTYARNLGSLSKLVLVQFDKDITVVPKESSHFAFYDGETLIPMRQSTLYKEDWIGLRSLDESNRLFLEHYDAGHMHISLDWFEKGIILKHLAVPLVTRV